MMAITISNSIKVKPLVFQIFAKLIMGCSSPKVLRAVDCHNSNGTLPCR
jgi:hypothetical protein